eukprot:Skav209162  [mRNA]  locus=scaffold1137:273554:281235:- [translate_table: standard]
MMSQDVAKGAGKEVVLGDQRIEELFEQIGIAWKEDWKLQGLDCMKMWPWMRDLPTCVWAGRGWAFDEKGLRRISSTGGSAAMQGVELFESIGAAEVAAQGENAKETGVSGSVSETAAPAEGPKPTCFMRNNSAKQSGVPHVIWDKNLMAWEVQQPTFDSKGKRIGRKNRTFQVKRFLVPGRSAAEADAAALEAAKAFRVELVQQGVLSEPKPQDPKFTSEVPGVRWYKPKQKWLVQIPLKDSQKKIHGGFTEKAAASALALREQHGLELGPWASTLAELVRVPVQCPIPWGVVGAKALDDLMDPPNGWLRTGTEILQGLQLLFKRRSARGGEGLGLWDFADPKLILGFAVAVPRYLLSTALKAPMLILYVVGLYVFSNLLSYLGVFGDLLFLAVELVFLRIILSVLLRDRDLILAESIRRTCRGSAPGTVVAVLGAAHCNGVKRHLEDQVELSR